MHKLWLVIIFITCLLFAHSGFCATRNIYIDPSVPSQGNGSMDFPYNSFDDINWTADGDKSITDWVREGHDVYINLKRGEIFIGHNFTFGASGVLGHRITLQPYGTGNRPIIDRNNTYGSAMRCIDTAFHDYLNIDNIEVRKAYFGILINAGIGNIKESIYVTVTNCLVDGAAYRFPYSMKQGIVARGDHIIIGGSRENGNEIKDVDGGDNVTAGVDIGGGPRTKNIEISYNKCYGNGINSGIDGITLECEPSGGPWETKIHHNSCYGHMYDKGSKGEGGIGIKRRDNVEIYANHCYNNYTTGISIQSCENAKIYANCLHEGRNGIIVNDSRGESYEKTKNISIYANVIYDFNFNGIVVFHVTGQGGVSDISIYNNVIAENATALQRTPDTGLKISSSVFGEIKIKNNIFYNNRPTDGGDQIQIYASSADIDVLDNNIYYVGPTKDPYIEINDVEKTIATIVGEGIYEQNGPGQVNPMFINVATRNFAIKAISPARGTGANLGETYSDALHPSSTDWTIEPPLVLVIKRPNHKAWDIGGYEIGGIAAPQLQMK